MSSNSVEAEFMNVSAKKTWPIFYQEIWKTSQWYQYTCVEAKKPENIHLNRYRDVSPYDHSRVVLKRGKTDYINANFVEIHRAKRKYILTQGPLESTVSHFWLMVWEQNSRAIVMLNRIIEKNEIKCHWYWPYGNGPTNKLVLSDVNLIVLQMNEENHINYIIRVFRITDIETNETREVLQFHFTTWPDFGVPISPVVFLKFLQRVRASGALGSDVGPAVVHCSAGIGRSGTFCLVDSSLVIMENEDVSSVSVPEILVMMRRDRMGLIQTPDQLRFSYLAIMEGSLKEHYPKDDESSLDSHFSSKTYDFNDDAPPSPPPRAESLTAAPARPLPAIPTSASLGNLNLVGQASSFDDSPTTLSDRNFNQTNTESSIATFNNNLGNVRQRRMRDLVERADANKERADANKERARESVWLHVAMQSPNWHLLALVFLVAGIAIYMIFIHPFFLDYLYYMLH